VIEERSDGSYLRVFMEDSYGGKIGWPRAIPGESRGLERPRGA
jgi:hypothetical protein